MSESIKEVYRLMRVSTRVFRQADVYFSKVYGSYFGRKWPAIRSALQQPEEMISIVLSQTSFEKFRKRNKKLGLSSNENVLVEISSLKNQLEQDHVLRKRPTDGSQKFSQKEWKIMKLDDETTRHGHFYDENIFFDIEAFESFKYQRNIFKFYVTGETPVNESVECIQDDCVEKVVTSVKEWLHRRKSSGHDLQVSIADILASSLLQLKSGDNILDLNSQDARFLLLSHLLNPDLSFGSLVSDCSTSKHANRRDRAENILGKFENDMLQDQKLPMVFKDLDTFDYESGLFRQSFDKIVVSVPFLNDRTALVDFSASNSFHDRNVLQLNDLSQLQRNFLNMALLAARPNASIVYFLRSLCPSHADCIVTECCQSFNTSNSETQEKLQCILVDLTRLVEPLKNLVNIRCGYSGIFIYPTFERNFGPAYISLLKIKS